jgi:hypothetical protein
LAIRGDEELDTLIKATIAGGGVIPHIHKVSSFNLLIELLNIVCFALSSHLLERKHLSKEVYLNQQLKQVDNKGKIKVTAFIEN